MTQSLERKELRRLTLTQDFECSHEEASFLFIDLQGRKEHLLGA